MTHLIERRANEIGLKSESTRLVFDLSAEDRDIFDVLARKSQQFLDTFESVKTRIPLPKTASVSVDGHFYRLPGHNRSFCYSFTESDSFLASPVLVFKGTEPLLPDFHTFIAWMSQAPLRRSTRVMTDHFPLAEGKIPGALSLKEAIREAEIALDVQKKHLKHYGELARLPTPLLIHRFSEDTRKACATILGQALSPSAFERIEPILENGLAIYVYYYPASPIRANYWGGMASPAVTRYIEGRFSEQAAVSGWVALIARLFYLGYLPYSVRNDGLGACMDFGNATLDGGFCDPDSIIPIVTSADDEFFREGVVQSLAFLQNTMQLLLGLSHRPDLYPSFDDFVCAQYIRYLLSEAVKSEARPGLRLDDRFQQLMSPRSIAEVKLYTTRRNRIGSYVHFAKRTGEPHSKS